MQTIREKWQILLKLLTVHTANMATIIGLRRSVIVYFNQRLGAVSLGAALV